MTPLRNVFGALLIPFHFTSVVLISGLSLLLAIAVSSDITGLLWMVAAFIITSWLFKYAFVMLEHVADGEFEAPVVSIEMLSPFEQRPLFLLVISITIGLLLWQFDGIAGRILIGVVVVMIPPSIGVLGATRRIMLALNPIVLWQTIRGMGYWYLAIWLIMIGAAALNTWSMQSGLWVAIRYWLMGMSVLMVFSLIGGVMYERRIELGHEPRKSPEVIAINEQRAHQRLLKQVLDEMYAAIRLGDLVRATDQLDQWLSRVDHAHLIVDCQMIHSTICGWNDAGMLTAATRSLATALVKENYSEMLNELITTTLKLQPGFTFKNELTLLPVIHGLQAQGSYDLAAQLATNFVNTFPAQVSPGITALMQRLSAIKQ